MPNIAQSCGKQEYLLHFLNKKGYFYSLNYFFENIKEALFLANMKYCCTAYYCKYYCTLLQILNAFYFIYKILIIIVNIIGNNNNWQTFRTNLSPSLTKTLLHNNVYIHIHTYTYIHIYI